MKFTPVRDFVVAKRLEAQETTPGGLVIPHTGRDKSNRAQVVAVGPGVYLPNGEQKPLMVKEGDKILFSTNAAMEFEEAGEKFLVLREYDICCVIN